MDKLNKWIDKTVNKSSNTPSLWDGIWGDNLASYICYRLQYRIILLIAVTLLHVLEFILINRSFDGESIYTILIIKFMLFLLHDGWWGGLDAMRSIIRRQYYQSSIAEAVKTHHIWLLISGIIIVFCSAVAFAYVLLYPNNLSIFTLILVVHTGVTLLLKVYITGAYAIRRVYFSMAAILYSDVLIFLAIISTHHWWGERGIFVALIISIFIKSLLAIYYIRSTLISLRLLQIRFSFKNKLKEFYRNAGQLFPVCEISVRMCTSLVIHIGWVLPLAIYFQFRTGVTDQNIILCYLLIPIFRIMNTWVRPFYFDFVSHKLDCFHNLRAFLLRQLSIAALAVAAFLTISAYVVTLYVEPKGDVFIIMHLFLLSSLICLQSLLAYNAFSLRFYKTILIACMLPVVAYVVCWTQQLSLYPTLMLCSMAVMLAVLLLYRYRDYRCFEGKMRPLDYIIHPANQKEGHLWGCYKLDVCTPTLIKSSLNKLFDTCPYIEYVSFIGKHTFVCVFHRQYKPEAHQKIMYHFAGLIKEYAIYDAVSALEKEIEQNRFAKNNSKYTGSKTFVLDSTCCVDELSVPRLMRRKIEQKAVQLLYPFTSISRVPCDVDVITSNGQIKKLIISCKG